MTPRWTVEVATVLPYTRDQVWQACTDYDLLLEMIPSSVSLELLTPEVPIATGNRLELRLKAAGLLDLSWTMEFQDVVAGHRFRDVQVQGPMEYWEQEHLLDDAPGGIRLTNRVEYLARGFFLGRLLNSERGRGDVERAFRKRHRRLQDFLSR